ncbi:hypothetical protein BWI96_09020 [Siphonobacter sp. SORGH_AS_0500]|uniref:hypothetical protein n=1 Tax=Siphonobacter sp. SORGH_AS_0500 TaxID=1864824 RepID=UPI000CB6F39F|nr:hypothetical protein [Siphonobacter sp. SORGH_AS_0500]PKK37010.1 hypothetical protein BWI96_09020 [Siphonobacter sp. SORGH_AS_0500]
MLFRKIMLSVLFLAGMGGMSACKKSSEETPRMDVSIQQTSLGDVLVDKQGKTLYLFAKDVAGPSTCTGGCLTAWPAFYQENPTLGNGLAAADFATITRSDGAKQTTYKGWPLYYFQGDAASGDTKGDKVESVWFVAKPHFSLMIGAGQLLGNDGKNYTSAYAEGTGQTIYLVDSVGHTLYAFAPDKNGKNTYTKSDFSNNATWPLAEFSAKNVPSLVSADDFKTITVFGRTQLTYKGWPLYYFGPDNSQRGSTKGVSVPRPGVWPIVNQNSSVAPN